jgi:SAP domain-containing ribonucleoprotein
MDPATLEEIEKRKRRAERFGIPVTDSVKAIERAQRFGIDTVTKSTPEKNFNRRRYGNQQWRNGKSKGNQATKPNLKSKPGASKPAVNRVLDDPTEAEKARKRAERFGGGNEMKKVKT